MGSVKRAYSLYHKQNPVSSVIFLIFNGLQKELRNTRKCSGMLANAPIAKTKPFGENDMQNMMGRIRRCAEDYNMIAEGDKIAVGVSGARIR